MGLTPELLVTLLQTFAIPELLRWIKSRQADGDPIDDAAILAKLGMDADAGIATGKAWLDAHPL